jgi:hypothetical protein
MEAENKNDGAKYSINMLIEQALMRQRVEMMDNFAHILKRLLIETNTSPYNNDFGGTCLFQVQINFDILIFEGKIDADSLEKWLNL